MGMQLCSTGEIRASEQGEQRKQRKGQRRGAVLRQMLRKECEKQVCESVRVIKHPCGSAINEGQRESARAREQQENAGGGGGRKGEK